MNHYLVDTKLIAYWLVQRGSDITDMFNMIANQLWAYPKGQIYLAFDDGASSFRKSLYLDYKGHRAKYRENKGQEEIDKHKAFERDYKAIIEFSKKLPVKVLHSKGVEADDMISIQVEELKLDPSNKVYLITGDMDYINSVVGTDNVFIINVNGGALINHEYVISTYGERMNSRDRFNVHKSIFGDKSDNIKFLRGFGEVKASEVFDLIYSKFDNPSNDDIVDVLTDYLQNYKNIKVHEFHQRMGNNTVKEAFECNMKLADTFRDTSSMTPEQLEQYNLNLSIPTPCSITQNDIILHSLDTVGRPVNFSYKAERVFSVKD